MRGRLCFFLVSVLVIIGASLFTYPQVAEAPPFIVYSTHCTATVTVTTTTETSACTLTGVNAEAGQVVRIEFAAQMTSGTGTTAITVRVRRGSGTGGALVGPANALTATAGNTSILTYQVEDSPGAVAVFPYSVTVQQTGATANGSVLDTEIFAFVL